MSKPFAIVTGAASGIGLALAAICAQRGFDLLVAADRPEIHAAADRFRGLGADLAVVEYNGSKALVRCPEEMWRVSRRSFDGGRR